MLNQTRLIGVENENRFMNKDLNKYCEYKELQVYGGAVGGIPKNKIKMQSHKISV